MIMNAAAAVVACNVYVSAGGGGGRTTKGILIRLLREAQDRCDQLSSSPSGSDWSSPPCSVVVHAFSDSVYDRSSFHFAGHPVHIAEIVSTLATESMLHLSSTTAASDNHNHNNDKKNDFIMHRHPFVGVVDHIAVMPLFSPSQNDTATGTKEDDDVSFGLDTNPTGWTARKIGETLIQKEHDSSLCPTEVYYYGHAHPAKRSLADCRRRYTNFFKSGGLADSDNNNDDEKKTNIVMVGAPPHFVENYNVRLSNAATKAQARALTRFLRERDGGLPGVEALTLPYSNDRCEVACNLLMPRISSTKHIDQKLAEWTTRQQQQPDVHPNEGTSPLIDAAYRVGTTEQQCLQILEQITNNNKESSPGSSSSNRKRHDETVLQRFQTYL